MTILQQPDWATPGDNTRIRRRLATARVDREVEERFERIDKAGGEKDKRNCFACLHCKVIPADDPAALVPDTICAQGLWSAPVSLLHVLRGGVKELRGRADCPQWESSK